MSNNNQMITKTEVNMHIQPTAPNESDKSVPVAASRINRICDDREDLQSDPQGIQTSHLYDPPRFDEIMVAEKS